jgi:hypothetical protein
LLTGTKVQEMPMAVGMLTLLTGKFSLFGVAGPCVLKSGSVVSPPLHVATL